MADTFVSSREVVEEVWREVAAKRDLRKESKIQAFPGLAVLENDQERHRINARCNLERGIPDLPSKFPFARAKRALKRRAALFTMAAMRRYLDDEQEFLAYLVRYQNNVAEAHDQLAREVATFHRGTLAECARIMGKLQALEERIDRMDPAAVPPS